MLNVGKNLIKLLTLAGMLCSGELLLSSAWGYGVGISSHPLTPSKVIMTTEVTGLVSKGSGAGLQVRYTDRINDTVTIEGGGGFSDSERSNRFFLATDVEFIPDYGSQPRFAMKGTYENAKEFSSRKHIIGVTPTVSKGVTFWKNHLAHPFISLPLGLALINDEKSYHVRTAIAAGVTSQVPFEDYKNLLVHLEGDVNLSNSFSAIFVGLSYPLH